MLIDNIYAAVKAIQGATASELSHVAIDFSSGDPQTIIPAPGEGKRIRVALLDLTALSNVEVSIKSGTTTIRIFQFAAMAWAPVIPVNLGENDALILDAVDTTRITGGVSYYVEAI